jgi:ABC-type transport system involved in multi-copper enzyme maturation permease subunit
MALWQLSPVFVYECAQGARRWQTYAGRTAFLGALLVSLTVAWVIRFPERGVLGRNALAAVGEAFFFAIAGTQLAMALLAAPAYTAASICLDKARGTLAHMLVTDLSPAEIVVGKLGARGLPIFGLVLAGVPVLVLATLLGGIEPEAVAGSFIVTLAVALVSCTLALTLSVWMDKPHEVLMATYGVEAVWLLALPLWYELQGIGVLGPAPDWLKIINPFTLAFAPYVWPAGATFGDYALFVGFSGGMSAALILFAVLTLRRAARRDKVRSKPGWHFPRFLVFCPALDVNPVLWREWHRRLPSRWMQIIWGLYAIGCFGASAIALGIGHRRGGDLAAYVNAFQFSIGLLLVSISSVASLFEERVNGSLDVLLATPLPTSSIVWGKWLASFRLVLVVALLPALLVCALPIPRGQSDAVGQFVLLVALMFAYGALVNSVGLALATWMPRFGVAMGLTVAAYALIAAGPVLLMMAGPRYGQESNEGFACLSPWYGVGVTTIQITNRGTHDTVTAWKIFWLIAYTAAAFALLAATQRTFDRCFGRVQSRP